MNNIFIVEETTSEKELNQFAEFVIKNFNKPNFEDLVVFYFESTYGNPVTGQNKLRDNVLDIMLEQRKELVSRIIRTNF